MLIEWDSKLNLGVPVIDTLEIGRSLNTQLLFDLLEDFVELVGLQARGRFDQDAALGELLGEHGAADAQTEQQREDAEGVGDAT